ncbi:hypothetical protein [Anaerorhabdus furcosa]|uniref:Uncharacterized protein n=1 Tax=Anaerorhabdus furcosa TaxID=118967 RepID=A0A1T4NVJ3_9FIRM|nr:hypothetical protein [Anaerorhabdus furcosa]SJZ83157.1 Protein of unknown function [Anaerorhabdus furcosa]
METRIIEHAKVIKKVAYDYFSIPGDLPFPSNEYEILFQTPSNEIIDCTCSIFEYQVLEEGDEGELIIKDHEIIKFADKIKEVKD